MFTLHYFPNNWKGLSLHSSLFRRKETFLLFLPPKEVITLFHNRRKELLPYYPIHWKEVHLLLHVKEVLSLLYRENLHPLVSTWLLFQHCLCSHTPHCLSAMCSHCVFSHCLLCSSLCNLTSVQPGHLVTGHVTSIPGYTGHTTLHTTNIAESQTFEILSHIFINIGKMKFVIFTFIANANSQILLSKRKCKLINFAFPTRSYKTFSNSDNVCV